MTDPEVGFPRLLEGLDRLEIAYMVTGSAASSSYGVWRATNDIDLVADISREQAGHFVAEFQGDFYVAAEIADALTHGRSFNLIHLSSFFKFDVFPLQQDKLHRVQFARRAYESAAVFRASEIEFAVASAEDVILSKLAWYREGGNVSEQQWNDVLGVIAQRRGKLDLGYLRQWAPAADVAGLLDEALAEEHGGR